MARRKNKELRALDKSLSVYCYANQMHGYVMNYRRPSKRENKEYL